MPNPSKTFAVLGPSLAVTPVPVTAAIYQELDQRFDGFKGRLLVATYDFHESWPTSCCSSFPSPLRRRAPWF